MLKKKKSFTATRNRNSIVLIINLVPRSHSSGENIYMQATCTRQVCKDFHSSLHLHTRVFFCSFVLFVYFLLRNLNYLQLIQYTRAMKKKTIISFHRSLKRQMASEIAGVVRVGWKCSTLQSRKITRK